MTPHQAAARSTVARKVWMAITGLILVAFLLMHTFGNLKLLIPDNGASFDEYAHALRTLLVPILPPKFFLWCFRILLLLAALIHIEAAVRLTFRNYDATGLGRYFKKRYLAGSFAARSMIWAGIIILLGVIVHLLMFTTQTITVGYDGSVAPHERVVLAFQQPGIWVMYLIWLIAVAFHIWHGFYSAFVTLGLRFGRTSTKVIHVLAWIVALTVLVGFMLVPTLILTGVIF